MGFLSLPEDTVTVTLTDDGVTANFKLKRALSKADVNFAFLRVVEATKDMPRRDEPAEPQQAQGVTLDTVLGLPDGQIAVLEKAIAEWDLTYPKGHPDYPTAVPLTPENVQALTSITVDALVEKVRELNQVRGADEEKNLGNGSSPTSKEPMISLTK